MTRFLSCASILVLACGAWPVLSLDAQGTVAKVTFRDGVEITVENAQFKYEYGVSQTPETPVGLYVKQTKRSPDLYLERVIVERGVTARTEITIHGNELGCIVYRWTPAKSCAPDGKGGQTVTPIDALTEIVVEPRSGAPTTLTSATLSVANAFLTETGYPFSKTVALVGQVKDASGKPNEFAWGINFAYANVKKEQVERICFGK